MFPHFAFRVFLCECKPFHLGYFLSIVLLGFFAIWILGKSYLIF